MNHFTESHVEEAALTWFGEFGYVMRPDIVVFVIGLRCRRQHRSISSVFVHNYRNYGTMPA